MTLEEAINILSRVKSGDPSVSSLARFDAILLGLEAGKREQECRKGLPREEWELLPGETKD